MGKIIFDMPNRKLENAVKEKISKVIEKHHSDELIKFRDMVSEIHISRYNQQEFATIVTHIYKAIIDER
tara:strand:+ start:747 stop:953 length:207 start_codon:yes stop_codon:yes gene_type:complete